MFYLVKNKFPRGQVDNCSIFRRSEFASEMTYFWIYRAKNRGKKKLLDEFKRGNKMASLWHKYETKQGTCNFIIHLNTP